MEGKEIQNYLYGLKDNYWYGLKDNYWTSSTRTSLVAQRIKHLPTMWETRVQSLGWDDLLEKEMATHSSILAWKIP